MAQVGNGAVLTHQGMPLQIGIGRTWRSISAGKSFTAAVATDGTLWAWGLNDRGQVGDGTRTA